MVVRPAISFASVAMVLATLLLTACGGGEADEVVYRYPEAAPAAKDDRSMFERWFGGSPIVNPQASTDLAAQQQTPGAADLPAGVGVNSYLWRASLDTLSFMPLASADPFGGTIITDWYSAPETPNEQFKVTVYILDKELRADGIRVSVFRQEKDAAGAWANATVPPTTPTQLENAILTRARQLRVATVDE
jgi:hypothetical protein